MNAAIKHKDEAIESHEKTNTALHSLRLELTSTQKEVFIASFTLVHHLL